jgi:hypothetical protein
MGGGNEEREYSNVKPCQGVQERKKVGLHWSKITIHENSEYFRRALTLRNSCIFPVGILCVHLILVINSSEEACTLKSLITRAAVGMIS